MDNGIVLNHMLHPEKEIQRLSRKTSASKRVNLMNSSKAWATSRSYKKIPEIVNEESVARL
jgi:hypothetical protein